MTQTIPTPQRPWQPSKTDRVETLGVLVASFVLAGLTVEFTGLNGKLGFVVSLFFSLLLLNYGFYFQKQGKAAAKDSLLQVFTVMAIVLTLIPITSIIATVVSKGYKGLHWGILTKDMALASVNDPIVAGGLGHALVGTILMVGGALIISFPIGVLTALYLTEIKGKASGNLVGGNLTLLTNTIGTRSEIDTKNKILFIEDIGEYLYSIDRMLYQLKRSGKLQHLRGLIIGGFTDMKDTERPFGKMIHEIIAEAIGEVSYPVCFDFPVSHGKENLALKIGMEYELNVTSRKTTLKEI